MGDTLGSDLRWFYRYIDDSIACISTSILTSLANTMNGWNTNIKWAIMANTVNNCMHPFLDLEVTVTNNCLFFQTFRKPMNAYLYLPTISCHPRSIARAI